MQTLQEFKDNWQNSVESHKNIHELFTKLVNENEWLNKHRTYVESGAHGFGERSFHWVYNLIVKELPDNFKFLDIGVFRGQSVGLVSGIATNLYNKQSNCYALSTFMGEALDWEPRDYKPDVLSFFEYSSKPSVEQKSNLTLITGLSQSPATINSANSYGPYDLVLVDGGHSKEVAKSDILNYLPMCKIGGYVLIDDCCNSFGMPWGFFTGIQDVTDVVDELLPPKGNKKLPTGEVFEFIANCVHLRAYKRIE